jgi:glycerol-3-phosphate O-acyltransferase / dihydroxyacetone phosphate acyltransferase
MPTFHRIAFGLAGLAAGLFYRRTLLGADVPREGPVLLVGNHPNGLVDPVFVAGATQRPVRFLGKEPLFRMPVLGAVLRGMGTLPVYRARDGFDTTANEETFRAVHAALAAGDAVALFPEGITHGEPQLTKLKTGAARMALGAEAAAGWSLGVRVVPVGLSFRNKRRFRSLAAAWVGEPIDARDFEARYRADERAAVVELTERIAQGLSAVILELDRWEDLPLLELAERIRGEGPGRRVERLKLVAEGARALRRRDPARLSALASDLADFGRRLARLRAEPGDLDLRYTPSRVLTFAATNALALLVGLPLAFLGAGLWWIPYRLTPVLARLGRPDPETFATAVLLAGIVLFPLWWLLLAVLAGVLQGALAAVLTLLLAPALGFFALVFLERRAEAYADLQVFLRLGLRREAKEELRAQRDALAARIEALEHELRPN